MKIELINDKSCKLIRGKLGVGQNLISVHDGKICHVILITTKIKSRTEVSWDLNLVALKNFKNKIRIPISRGLLFHSNIISYGPIL